ncbi:MAG: hypothetical protein EA404_14075 [Spirochaetaceae bacterium]|nr:MAG: hypothetical protein EA404_14075 [Spirochaetaceae bacterium]
MLAAVMEKLTDKPLPCAVDFVAFNGEEYFGVPGQLGYLDALRAETSLPDLVINVDGVGHRGSRNVGQPHGDRGRADAHPGRYY